MQELVDTSARRRPTRREDDPAGGAEIADEARPSLSQAAVALYGDLRLSRILSCLLQQSGQLLDVRAGSVSIVDAARTRYAKAAERGARCQLGRVFTLDEGVTGRVAEGRRPVVLRSYTDVARGHLPPSHPLAQGAVAAVPIWWRGEVLGVNIAFAGCDRTFSTAEVDRLEVLSQVGAAGIVSAAASDAVLSELLSDRPADDRWSARLVVTEVGAVEHRDAGSVITARALVAVLERVLPTVLPPARLRVVLLHQRHRVRVLLHDEAGALDGAPALLQELRRQWAHAVASHGGTVDVERVPGWGVLVLADLPHAARPAAACPFTGREGEVLRLMARGLTDGHVADELFLSRKTVEKHVSAVLRKTGTTTRTAAVMRALELGWLPAAGRP